jgi:hypothetical protein
MAYTYPEIKAFQGLFSQANSFTVPDGALETADNIVINRDGVIAKRRGYYQYYNPSSDTLNALILYQSKLLAVFSDKIGYFTDTGSSPSYTGTRTTLSGATVAVTGTRTARSAQSNKNLYFTTDNGVLKLEAYTGTIYKAGVPPATDIRANFAAANGPIGDGTDVTTDAFNGTSVAWRLLFGRRDANDNLLLGVPSDIVTLTNSASTAQAWARVSNVVTITTTAHNLVSGMTIYVENSLTGGVVGANPVLDGAYSVTVLTSSTFTIASTDTDDTGTLSWFCQRATLIEASIPSEITSTTDGYFYQLYRSSQTVSDSATPDADFKLIDEQVLTSAQITAGFLSYTDDIDDILRGAELYTNPNSQEGELQANDRPPLCDDMILFKNHMLYANCNTRHLLNLQIVDPASLTAADYFEIKVDTTTRRYVARGAASTSVANRTVKSTSITSSSGLRVDYVAHGLADGDSVYVSNITGGTLTAGTYYVRDTAADSFRIATSIGGSAVAYNSETALYFQGVRTLETTQTSKAWVRASNVVTVTSTAHGLSVGMQVYVSASSGGSPEVTTGLYTIVSVPTDDTFTFAETAADDASGNTLSYAPFQPMFHLDSFSSSTSVKLRNTAQGIVKAINRDTSSLVYAKYTSGIDEIPGKFRLQAKGFTGAMYVRASSSTPAVAVSPTLPTSFSTGTQVYSRNDDLPNIIAVSKIGEPEAVPLSNQFAAGASNQDILRIVPLRDSVIILKADGVFRMNGDSTGNFQIVPLDTTVICVAASTVAVLNNQVLALTNQGVCLITDSTVEIVSRKIEDPLAAVIGNTAIATESAAVAYESDRTYMLSTIDTGESTTTITYIYNVLNDTWTTSSDLLFSGGLPGPNDTMYLITDTDLLLKERKNKSRIDYCGQNYDITVESITDAMTSAVIVSSTIAPAVGMVIVKSENFTRIKSVTDLGAGSRYTCEFERASNLEASDALSMYAGYTSTIKLAPFHGGLVGRMKQFSQFQIHQRDDSTSRLLVSFISNTYGGGNTMTWRSETVRPLLGFGNDPFGLTPFGQSDSTTFQFASQPAPIIRTYIPIWQQRSTFIQPLLEHISAGEAMNIQAMAFAVRSYGERVSR